jgi:flagellar basal body-associated protein FliL
MWTLRFSLLILVCITCFGFVAGYLAGVSYPDLISRPFTVKTSSGEPARTASGIIMNLPQVVAPVDDGQEFYSVQAGIALEIDHAGTAAWIRARHEVIDRHLMELLHTYRLRDLRSGGLPSTLRKDIKRVINTLLPKGQVRHVYITNWLMTPAGY